MTARPTARAVRIGLGYVAGVRGDEVAALVEAREAGGPFRSLGELASRAGAGRPALAQLAWAGACDSLGARQASRREVLWELGVAAPGEPVAGRHAALAPARRARRAGAARARAVGVDDRRLRHDRADARRATRWRCCATSCRPATVSCRDLETLRHEQRVRIGGLVVARQRPGTAKGIVFILIEDEFGTVNLIVPPPVYERHRLLVRSEPLLIATGRLEKLAIAGGAINIYVDDLEALDRRRQVAEMPRSSRSRNGRGGGGGGRRSPTSGPWRPRCSPSAPGRRR